MSSWDNHTIVPTETMFGRLTGPCTRVVSAAAAVATAAIIAT
jgi:hypothetical protein